MANRFMTEGYLKFYLYAIHGFNIVLGALCLLLVLLPAREGLFEEVVLARDSAPWVLLLVTAVFLVAIGVFGLLATFFPTRFLVPLCCLLCFLIVLEISAGITIVVSFVDHKREKLSRLNGIFGKYTKDLSFKVHVDKMQKKHKCCGVEGPEYWKGNLTKSCCQDAAVEKCKPWYDGCSKSYIGPVNEYIKRICVAVACIAWVQGFGAVCAVRFKRAREKAERGGGRGEEGHPGQPLSTLEPLNT